MKDKELIAKLKQLKTLEAGGRPQESWLVSNKEILMSQIQPRIKQKVADEKVRDRVYYWQFFNNVFQQKVLRPVVASLVIVAMMLTYTATVSVANASLPGDALYSIKTTTEKVQLALTFNEEDKVNLQMDFAVRRVDELNQLVSQDNVESENVIAAANNIVEGIEAVTEGLDNITTIEAVEVAKEIDSKTLELGDNIVVAQESLTDELKEEVGEEIDVALASTEEAGNNALGVIVSSFEGGDNVISNEEVTSRLAERIKNAEEVVEDVAKAIEGVATSTESVILLETDNTATSTLESIIERPGQAQEVIEEAKDLLDQSDFGQVLDKIKESQEIVETVEEEVQAIVQNLEITEEINSDEDIQENVLGTSTEALISNENVDLGQASTTEETSESTQELIQ